MSISTFMDSLLFNIQCDLGTVAGEISYLVAPITPNFVFEKRIEKQSGLSSPVDESPSDIASRLFGARDSSKIKQKKRN